MRRPSPLPPRAWCGAALEIARDALPVDAWADGPPLPEKPEGSRHRRVYGQRWQVESAFSRHKRLLGPALAARSDGARERECLLRVLTHNLMLLAAARN